MVGVVHSHSHLLTYTECLWERQAKTYEEIRLLHCSTKGPRLATQCAGNIALLRGALAPGLCPSVPERHGQGTNTARAVGGRPVRHGHVLEQSFHGLRRHTKGLSTLHLIPHPLIPHPSHLTPQIIRPAPGARGRHFTPHTSHLTPTPLTPPPTHPHPSPHTSKKGFSNPELPWEHPRGLRVPRCPCSQKPAWWDSHTHARTQHTRSAHTLIPWVSTGIRKRWMLKPQAATKRRRVAPAALPPAESPPHPLDGATAEEFTGMRAEFTSKFWFDNHQGIRHRRLYSWYGYHGGNMSWRQMMALITEVHFPDEKDMGLPANRQEREDRTRGVRLTNLEKCLVTKMFITTGMEFTKLADLWGCNERTISAAIRCGGGGGWGFVVVVVVGGGRW